MNGDIFIDDGLKDNQVLRWRADRTIDAYRLIYRNTFNPLNSLENLLDKDDDSKFNFQFKLDIHLSSGMTYVLVMTTNEPKETGKFSIIVLGDNKVILDRLSKCICTCLCCILRKCSEL